MLKWLNENNLLQFGTKKLSSAINARLKLKKKDNKAKSK